MSGQKSQEFNYYIFSTKFFHSISIFFLKCILQVGFVNMRPPFVQDSCGLGRVAKSFANSLNDNITIFFPSLLAIGGVPKKEFARKNFDSFVFDAYL